jgi:molecular chaperone GrpE
MSKPDPDNRPPDRPDDAQTPRDEPPAETSGEARAGDQTPQDPESPQAERESLLARLQRLGADYQNYQKRAQRDIAQAREYANEDLVKALLPVLDDMERALEHARENHPADDPLLTGMQLVHDKAIETLARFGVTRIEAVGETLDPSRHSAMMQQPTDEHPPMTVLSEVQKGYQLKGRTLRPASVVVAKAPDEQDPPA